MDIEGYVKLFVGSKKGMSLTEAADFVHYIASEECVPLTKLKFGSKSRMTYIRRKFQIIVCSEIEKELRSAPPWMDYREVFARLEWPYMYRVISHMEGHKYDGPYGEKWRESDAWFVEMWTAHRDVFCRMPGIRPECSTWDVYEALLRRARKETDIYRRNL